MLYYQDVQSQVRLGVVFDFVLCWYEFAVTLTLNYFELKFEERLMRNINNIMCYVYWCEMYFDIDSELSGVKC